MGSESLLSGTMLAVANIAPLYDLGSYGLFALAIYLTGFLVIIPVLAFDELEDKEISGSIQKTGTNIFRAFSKGYVFILFSSLFWPLIFVFIFPYACFTRQTSYLVMPFTAITISLSILAIDALTKPATQVLLGAIEEDSWQRSRTARDILQHRADPTAIQPLLKLVQNSPTSHVRNNALLALSGVENEDVLSLLFSEFTRPKVKIRNTARRLLANYEPSLLIAKLIPLLEDNDEYVSRQSAELLENKIKQLIARGDRNPENAANLLEAPVKKYVQLLIAGKRPVAAPQSTNEIWYDKFKRVWAPEAERRKAISSLNMYTRIICMLDDPVVTSLLLKIIGNQNLPEEVQGNVAKGLGRKDAGEDVYQALADALGRIIHKSAKKSIISSLGIIENKSAIPLLVAQLTDWRSAIQKETILTLSKYNWEPSTTAEIIHLAAAKRDKTLLLERWEDTKKILLEDLSSKDSYAQDNAVYTFIRLGRKVILPDLVRIIQKLGHIGLARTYLHSGNKTLKSAGIKWANTHGYVIKTVKRSEADGGYAGWGRK